MRIIKAKKIPHKKVDTDEELAKFCYYFPQYTLAHARKLPYKRIQKMLKVVRKEQAAMYYTFTQIAAAPHMGKGEAVKSLMSEFKEIINS